MKERLVVIDFGSQYAHLIAKRLRGLSYYTEIASPDTPVADLLDAKGIILSGGPASLSDPDAPDFNSAILDIPVPILGLCYGHYIMQKHYGGKVRKAVTAEYGKTMFYPSGEFSPLFINCDQPQQVWMSHQDEIKSLGSSFTCIGHTNNCDFAAAQDIRDGKVQRFSLQFHPEVTDTEHGETILYNFAHHICEMEKNWDQSVILDQALAEIKEKTGDKKVLLFLSGGVDSSVTFALLNKALGKDRVLGLHIDNGFMRQRESIIISERYQRLGFDNFKVMDASTLFYDAVRYRTDPQEKRHAIGEAFITARNQFIKKLDLDADDWLLAQGTLYPDIIESGGTKNSNVIKTHHNRVQGIQDLIERGLVIEPLRNLYKDEVRRLGKELDLPDELIQRHPFPGPGLAINILCLDDDGIEQNLADADSAEAELAKYRAEIIAKSGGKLCKVDILPVKSTGVQGDQRTYRFPVMLSGERNFRGFHSRPVFYEMPDWETLEEVSTFVTNHLRSVNRCVVRLWQNVYYAGVPVDLWLSADDCSGDRLEITRKVDAIVLEELKKSGWYHQIFQHLTISLPHAAGRNRCSIVLRPVCSEDVMTATFAKLDKNVLGTIISRIVDELYGIDAIYYDVTNKPPATFGWE